jgi:hypothetical protein
MFLAFGPTPQAKSLSKKISDLESQLSKLEARVGEIASEDALLKKPLQWTEFEFEIASDDQPNLPKRLLFPPSGTAYDLPTSRISLRRRSAVLLVPSI